MTQSESAGKHEYSPENLPYRRHPFQILQYARYKSRLFSATAGTVTSFDTSTGAVVAKWKAPNPQNSGRQETKKEQQTEAQTAEVERVHISAEASSEDVEEKEQGQGHKRKRGEELHSHDEGTPVKAKEPEKEQNTIGKGDKKNVKRNKTKQAAHPVINCVGNFITTRDGKLVICSTLEDKTVRVLDAETLQVVDEWVMSKRPSGLSLTDNDTKVLVGDKFGDVFVHPLRPYYNGEYDSREQQEGEDNKSLTRAAIENSQKSGMEIDQESDVVEQRSEAKGEVDMQGPPSAIMKIEEDGNKLLLGHVSLLTSLTTVTLPPTSADANAYTYIITADRDEHVRITRYPNTFVIDGFCLGHRSFVSRLLVPKWDKTLLITGGGDDWLGVWNWKTGKLKKQVDLRQPVQELAERDGKIMSLAQERSSKRRRDGGESIVAGIPIAVNGIWESPVTHSVYVGLEGIPALFAYHHTPADILQYSFTVPLAGPILSLAVDPENCALWVSIEHIDILIQKFELGGSPTHEWNNMETTKMDKMCLHINDQTIYGGIRMGTNGEEGGDPEDLKDRLYTIEALRKVYNKNEGGEEAEGEED